MSRCAVCRENNINSNQNITVPDVDLTAQRPIFASDVIQYAGIERDALLPTMML